jgi:hypothetical protein
MTKTATNRLPRGCKLFSLMGEYYVVDAKGCPFACSPSKEQAIANARAGIRPDGKVRL